MIGTGEPNTVAIAFFLGFIALSLGITVWAARRTRTADQFYTAGGGVTALQNGLALAGDYMSAASFLGIAGIVSQDGFDGLIYSVGWLVGWPVVTFLIAEPLRNLGKYTFSDVVAYRLRELAQVVVRAHGNALFRSVFGERRGERDPQRLARADDARVRDHELHRLRGGRAQRGDEAEAEQGEWAHARDANRGPPRRQTAASRAVRKHVDAFT